jgi:hypothetical protein
MSMIPMILLLLAQAAGPEEVVLSGTVLGVDGKPAAGADVVLEPAARRVRSLDYGRRSRAARNVFAAAALIDPAWAVALADSLPEDTPGTNLHPKAVVRRVIGDVLAHGGPGQWDLFDNPLRAELPVLQPPRLEGRGTLMSRSDASR